MAAVYVPRSPTTSVLHQVVRGHLAGFLAEVEDRTDGAGLPGFVTREFRKFLGCGVLSRGFCPSCGGRRMTERAAHLIDRVFPDDVPVRQWVLSVPHRLRYRLAYDHTLCRAAVQAFVRGLRAFHRRQARRAGLGEGQMPLS